MKKEILLKVSVSVIVFLFIGAGVTPNMLTTTVKADLTTGLVGYWSFDEGSGSIVYDSSGNNKDGTLYGDPQWVQGLSGNALEFDGIDDYVEIHDTGNFEFVNQDLTFLAWVKIVDNANTYRYFISLGDPIGANRRSINLAKARSDLTVFDGRMFVEVETPYPADDYTSMSNDNGDELPRNEWIMIAGILDYDNSHIELYINGIIQDDINFLGDFDLSIVEQLKLYIGRWVGEIGYPTWHKGLIDEVRIYDRALTENEILDLFKEPFENHILIGKISTLNSDEHTTSFNAENLIVISLSPFNCMKYSSDEKITVLNQKLGLLTSNFALGFFKTII